MFGAYSRPGDYPWRSMCATLGRMADTLADFLLARIAEDGARASRCAEWPECEGQDENGEDSYGCPAHFRPTRVLAECDAKRRIVEDWQAGTLLVKSHKRWLRFLALPYSDHPAYRDEWRP